MGSLGNAVKKETVVSLEARKSYAFSVKFIRADDTAVSIVGAVVRLVVARPDYRGGDVTINRLATLVDAVGGIAQFELQATDLDLSEDEYPFSITLISAAGYSTVVAKGVFDLRKNTETTSTASVYAGVNPTTQLSVTLDGGDVVEVHVDSIPAPTGPQGPQGPQGIQGLPGKGSAAWTALTIVTAGEVRQAPDGSYIKSNSARPTGAAYDTVEASFWTPVSTFAGTQEQLALATTFAAPQAKGIGYTGAIVLPYVNVKDFGAVGNGIANDTPALATALTAAKGGTLRVPKGTYLINSTLTVEENTELQMDKGAVISMSVATTTTVIMLDDATITGGKIVNPATFDPANSGSWTYAVVNVIGHRCSIRNLSIENVPKCGIGIRNVDNTIISGCRIDGNLPEAMYTGTETGHFGINLDPGGSATDGNLIVTGNIIRSCVQGTLVANIGTGAGRGVTVVGNTFEGCRNHGFYGGTGTGHVVSSNNFNRCQIPVAVDGSYHVISGNSMTTYTSGAGIDITGISVRDAVGCIISNNTIQGDSFAGGAVISCQEQGGVALTDNLIQGNIIKVTGVSGQGIKLGGGLATTFSRNRVIGNIVEAPGSVSTALIGVIAATGAAGPGCEVSGNTVRMTGAGYGIQIGNLKDAVVRDNHIALRYNAASAVTVGMIVLSAVTKSLVSRNLLNTISTLGTNIALRGVWETTGNSGNRIERNVHDCDTILSNATGQLTSYTPLVVPSGGLAVIDETGPGVPSTTACARGSLWRRSDGAAGSTLYVKTSDTSATEWFAIPGFISATATLDFPSIATQAQAELTITVTGAVVGDLVLMGPPVLAAGLQATAFVSAVNTVKIRLYNSTGSPIDPVSATWNVAVIR